MSYERRHEGVRPERPSLPRPTAWRTIALVLACLTLALVLAVAFGEPVR